MLATTQLNCDIQFWLFKLFSITHSGLISYLLETVLSTMPLYLLCCLRRPEGCRGYIELNQMHSHNSQLSCCALSCFKLQNGQSCLQYFAELPLICNQHVHRKGQVFEKETIDLTKDFTVRNAPKINLVIYTSPASNTGRVHPCAGVSPCQTKRSQLHEFRLLHKLEFTSCPRTRANVRCESPALESHLIKCNHQQHYKHFLVPDLQSSSMRFVSK